MSFENFSDNPNQDSLADGLRVDIQGALTKVSGVFLIGIGSAMSYRDKSAKLAASEMGVQIALAGSVRRAGNKVRVSTTLTDESSGEIVWAEQYDRELRDAGLPE